MDKTLLLWIQGWANPSLDGFFWWISDQFTFTLPLLLILAGIASARFRGEGLKAWCLLILLIGITDILGKEMKSIAKQARPCQDMYQELYYPPGKQIKPCGKALKGMPSNHALNFFAAALATVLVIRRRSWSIFIFSVAVLVGVSRVYLGKHYPSQVVVGAWVGAVTGWAYAWLCLRYFSFLRRMGKNK